MSIRFLSAGDSHGEALTGIIEGVPAGVRIVIKDIQKELMRRRKSYGRSSRQIVEQDEVNVISGLWNGRTTGAPLTIVIPNRARAWCRESVAAPWVQCRARDTPTSMECSSTTSTTFLPCRSAPARAVPPYAWPSAPSLGQC